MNLKEFHISGKYALLVALIAGIATLGASALQVYKPFSKKLIANEIYLDENKKGLFSLNYLVRDGLNINIFSEIKREDFSINPEGKKVFFIKRVFTDGSKGLKNIMRIVNYDTSYSNEIVLSSYVDDTNSEDPFSRINLYQCQISIKGWEKPNSIILNINHCSGSVGFTMTEMEITQYPVIKSSADDFYIRDNGDYIISFDEFNQVVSVVPINQ